ncbi:hypothetical protein J7J62_02360 [bacterium]|nr:hypothetical protein [bacterium]
MKQFLGNHKNFDIYFIKDEGTGNNSYYEATNNILNEKYIIVAIDFEQAKRILDILIGNNNFMLIASEQNAYLG